MRIECTTPFLDGRERFEAGDTFTVSDERGAAFVANGWAKKLVGRPVSVARSRPANVQTSRRPSR